MCARLEREDREVLAYRFDTDRFCTAKRFDAYSTALSKRFLARVLPEGAANREPSPFSAQIVGCPHSVPTR